MTAKDVWFVNVVSQIGEAEELCSDTVKSYSAGVDFVAMPYCNDDYNGVNCVDL